MRLTKVMVTTYIIDCCLMGTKPCKFFQFNSPWFNNEKGIFSKIELDELIPDKWRLDQRYDDGQFKPLHFPVFLKPEWGQNAGGIYRADDERALEVIRQQTRNARVPYMIQACAPESREFEIFCLCRHDNLEDWSVFTITEAHNDEEDNPVNSIHNPGTRYIDITDRFDSAQKKTLFDLAGQIGRFRISRLSVRADSIEDLLAGNFHVIELNLFTPMPIHMLDKKYSLHDIWRMNISYMWTLARITKYRDKSLPEKPVYTKIMLYNRESRLANFVRSLV